MWVMLYKGSTEIGARLIATADEDEEKKKTEEVLLKPPKEMKRAVGKLMKQKAYSD